MDLIVIIQRVVKRGYDVQKLCYVLSSGCYYNYLVLQEVFCGPVCISGCLVIKTASQHRAVLS